MSLECLQSNGMIRVVGEEIIAMFDGITKENISHSTKSRLGSLVNKIKLIFFVDSLTLFINTECPTMILAYNPNYLSPRNKFNADNSHSYCF